MIHFSERIAVAAEYEKWKRENIGVEDNPISFLVFMQNKGLLNEKELKKFCDNYYLKEKKDNG